MTYSLNYKTSEVWKDENHVLGSDYRPECLNVRAYQSFKNDPKRKSDSFFNKQNGKCKVFTKEEVRKENIKRGLIQPNIKDFKTGVIEKTFKNYVGIKWNEFKTEWNHPTRNPLWFRYLLIGTCSFSLLATFIIGLTN